MNPIEFKGCSFAGKPKTWKDEDCGTLPYKMLNTELGLSVVSMWEPSEKDLEAIKAGRPIIVQIYLPFVAPIRVVTYDEKGNTN